MKNKVIHIILFVLTVAALCLPAIQQHGHLFRLKRVMGTTVVTSRPEFSLKSFMKGEYQAVEDQYLTENIGFRECYIRYYNQLVWSLFRKSQNETIFVGKDNWLFNDFVMEHYKRQSVYHFFGSNELAIKKMNSDARLLRQLQGVLDSFGITLFVCITPTKDMVCDAYMPEVKEGEMGQGMLAIDFYPPVFDSLGIRYLDFSSYFMQLCDKVSYPLYLKSASHWSNLAATYMADTLLRYMEAVSGHNLHNLSFSAPYSAPTRTPDDDLESVMNLMWPIESDQNLYVDAIPDDDSTAIKPRWLVVGDSYFRGWQYSLPLDSLFETHHYWRYNNTVFDDPLHENVSEVDQLRALLSSDIITILYNPCNLYDLNRGFLTKSLFSLCYEEGVVNWMLGEIKKQIESRPEWLERMQDRALQQGAPLDQVLASEASYMLNNAPGDYFVEFNDTVVPTRRNSRIAKVQADLNDPEKQRLWTGVGLSREWRNSIMEKAKAAHLTLDQAVERDVDWMVQQKKEN